MTTHTLLLTIVISGTIFAETIGDFAPLALGNQWIYTTHSKQVNQAVTISESQGTHTVTVIDSRKINDTTWYYLAHALRQTVMTPENLNETISRSYSDTLFEIAESGLKNVRQSHVFPVWLTHSLHTTASQPDSLEFINGAWEFSATHNGGVLAFAGSGTRNTTYRFRQGVGIIRTSSSRAVHMEFITEENSLQSFNGTPLNTTPVTIAPNRFTTQTQDRCRTSVAFPHISIVKNGTTYNLLGRVHSEKATNAHRTHKWHEQVYDLFR